MENKWWEYYAVRYFVGTVVGAVLIAVLNGYPGSPYHEVLTRLGGSTVSPSTGSPSAGVVFVSVSLMTALGFAYCYIASAPMLTFHACRAHFRLSKRKAWIPGLGTLVVFFVGTTWVASALLGRCALAVAIGIVGAQVGLVVLVLVTRFREIATFYCELATARAAATETGKTRGEKAEGGEADGAVIREYVTSYRHLREHGNAVTILILEGTLAGALLGLSSITATAYMIGVWLAPSTIAWVVGTVLEDQITRPGRSPC